MNSPTQVEGSAWEDIAAEHLAQQGLQVIARGYRCRGGELDLVCEDGDQLVIVEVRARRHTSHGGAAATVNWRKRRKIIFAARHFLMTHPDRYDAPVRFDVVAIDNKDDAKPTIDWITNAFDAT
jgi:putative endonuclease